jgi:hypothetical protein
MDAPLTPGDWSYGNRVARFGEAGAAPILALSCAGEGQVRIEYFRAPAAPLSLTIRTETMARAITDLSVVGANNQGFPLRGTIPARDPLLDAMAFSKGRFAVEIAGQPTLYVPSYPEVTRVIEDCR